MYFETLVCHKPGYDFVDKGYVIKEDASLTNVRKYGRRRLNLGIIRGWYIEADDGCVIEKHTHTLY